MHYPLAPLSIALLFVSFTFASIINTQIEAGTIHGAKCVQNAVTSFQSIPYAQPPVGSLRFAAPQAFQEKFNGSYLNATTPSPSCIQFGSAFVEQGRKSEDCLFLDIWVPPEATQSSKLPVKTWIYGGGNNAGGISDPSYNGCNLAMQGTLVVSINYRLGPLGFLALGTAGVRGNQAIQDILLGLQWIQDNIGAFGGDPKQVLLFGQSAGAVDTFTVSTLPQAPKLMKAVIPESGGGKLVASATAMQDFSAKYAELLNCSIHDTACLRAVPASVLNSTLPPSADVGIEGSPLTAFGPNLDGTIIPAQPSTAGVQVPAILGSTTTEGTLLILASVGEKALKWTNTDYLQFLSSQFAPSIVPLITKQFPISAFNATPYPGFYAVANVITDAAYKCPAYRGLKTAIAKGVPAYTYLWAHTPSCEAVPGIPKQLLKVLGPTHATELPFVFGELTGYENGTCNLTASEGQLSQQLIQSWTAMASHANPSAGGLQQWPQFSVGNNAGVVINQTAEVGAVDYSVCDFWDKIAALNVQLGSKVGAGNLSANGTAVATGGSSSPTGVAGGSGSTSGPAAFEGMASRISGGSVLSLTGFAVMVTAMFVVM